MDSHRTLAQDRTPPLRARFGPQPASIRFDLRLAVEHTLPVLISAPPKAALRLAEYIICHDARHPPARVIICDARIDDTVSMLAAAASGGHAALVVCEAHALGSKAQILLRDRVIPDGRLARIIVTSSESLYQRVLERRFDEQLFYRLNGIHIVTA